MTQLDGVTFTIVAKSGRSIPYMALCQVGQEMAGKSIFIKYLPHRTKTLSKILCKWKQDSVVSLFLYLDSVFKYKHKLVHNQSPV